MRHTWFGLALVATRWSVIGSVLMAGAVLAAEPAGNGSAAPAPASSASPAAEAAGQSQGKESAKPSADGKADPFVVPDGTPDQLLDYIRALPEAAGDDRHSPKFYRALVEAAKRILAAKPEEDQAEIAAQVWAQALAALDATKDPTAGDELAALPGVLEKQGRAALAHQVSLMLWQLRMSRALQTSPEDLLKVITDFRNWLGDSPKPDDLQLAMETAHLLEMLGNREAAAEAYRDYVKRFRKLNNPELDRLLTIMEGAARRLELVGKPIDVTGKTLDGQPLDWAKYKDKVVLVVFWATWCAPCRAETPHIMKLYEAYHDQGFDVIGISLDQQAEDARQYVQENAIPWTILFSDPSDKESKSMAVHYGIMGIPATILVGKDGKVTALNLRAAKLDEELERLLGPAPEKPAAKPAAGS